MAKMRMANLDNDFMNFVIGELGMAIGPIAKDLVEEAVEDLCSEKDDATKLVDMLSIHIPCEKKKALFISKVTAHISS